MLELDTSLRAKDDLRAGACRNFPMTADEVGVQVRLDHVLDLQSLRIRFLDVLINIALRIDNRSITL
jgi:hypothetical protein